MRGAIAAVDADPHRAGRLLVTTRDCTICGLPGQLADVDPDALADWVDGAAIQDAMPDRSKTERELLMTGLHGECYGQLAPQDPS